MENKKGFIEAKEKEIQGLSDQMDAIQKKIADLADDEKVECRKSVKLFYERLPAAFQHIEDLKSAEGSDESKQANDIESIIGELKSAIERASEDLEAS